jgi:hypothetical protein
MKIISSFKDYYDHALAWTSDDDKVTYRRETTLLTTIPENNTKMKFKMRQKLTQRYGEARRNTEFFV